MVKASSFAKYAQENAIQLTVYYGEGHSETFSLPITSEVLQQQLTDILSQPWLTFHLADQTVMISTAHLVKIEVKPPLPTLSGPGTFMNAQLVTALQRGAIGRFQVPE